LLARNGRTFRGRTLRLGSRRVDPSADVVAIQNALMHAAEARENTFTALYLASNCPDRFLAPSGAARDLLVPVGPLDVYCVRPDGAMLRRPLTDLLPMSQTMTGVDHPSGLAPHNRSSDASGRLHGSGLSQGDVESRIDRADLHAERNVRLWRVADVS